MGDLRWLRRRSWALTGMVALSVPGVAGAGVGTTEPPPASTPADSAVITDPDDTVAPEDPVTTQPVATEPVTESEPAPSTDPAGGSEPGESPPTTESPDAGEAPTAISEPTASTIEPDCTATVDGEGPLVVADECDIAITPLALIDVPNPGAIVVPAAGSAEQIGPASPYPSTVTVAGQTGVVTDVTLQLFGVTHGISGDLDILLVGPEGDSLIVMSDISHESFSALDNVNITFADTGSAPPTSGVITGSHTWRPTDNDPGGDSDPFAPPAPSPGSATTFATAFAGSQPNGTWSLYVVDDTTGDVGTISGGWNLTVDSEEEAVGTTTSVGATPNPSLVGADVTFTATVLAGTTPVTAGTVTFRNGATVLAADVPVTASGQASFTTPDLTENTHTISATFNGATGFLTSSGVTSQVVDAPTTTPATGQWCNTGPIAGPGAGPATPYPSRISVAGAGTTTSLVTVQLAGVFHTAPIDFDVMLVSPTGQNLILMSDVGGMAPVGAPGATLTFADSAGGTIPAGGPLATGTYRPSDSDADAADGVFPAPAPVASPATTLATFNGADPNGVWQLFVLDDASADVGAVGGGWCLNITTPAPTTTALESSDNPSTFGQAVTLTATVTSDGSPVTDGSVTFTDGATSLGTVGIDSSGEATLTTSSLTVGSHPITAAYGATTAFEASDASLVQVVNRAPTSTALTSSLNPTTFGQAVTFTATVTSDGSPVSAGSVTFTDGTASLGTVTLDGSGQATFTTSTLAVGSHSIAATFGATAGFGASTDSLDQVVEIVGTDTVLTSSVNPSVFGQSVTFTATVTIASGPDDGDPAAGAVTFAVGPSGTELASVVLDAGGQASFTTSSLPVGTNLMAASYEAPTGFQASADSLDQVVDGVADAGGPYLIDEGQDLALDGSASLGGASATHAWDVDGDGDFDDATGVTPTLTWADLEALGFDGDDPPALHQVTLQLTDGPAFTAVTGLSIANVAPTATSLDNDGPVAEGATATVTIIGAADPSAADLAGLTYHFDFDDDGTEDAVSSSPSAVVPATYLANGPGTRTVTAFVADPDGGTSAELATTITITNEAATATIDGPSTAVVGEPVTIKVGALDPSPDDMAGTFMFTVDWGDGTPAVTLPGPADPPVTHTYTQAGTYTVVATVVDPDGEVSEPLSFTMTVAEQVAPSTTAGPSTTTAGPSTTEPGPTTTAGPRTSAPPTGPGVPTTTAAGTLPTTGDSSSIVSMIALALLAAGAAALLATRRLR